MPSYDSVNYGLRPSKSVERKLFVECLQLLSKCGYHISDYRYVGMGSPHYVDFSLFHRQLYIDQMLCAESSNAKRRMEFNLPFGFVELEMSPIGTVISKLDRIQKHLAWLDYDYSLGNEVLADLSACIQVLATGSILIISVVADLSSLRNLVPDDLQDEVSEKDKRIYIVDTLNGMFSKYMDAPIPHNVTKKQIATAFSQAITTFLTEKAKDRKPKFSADEGATPDGEIVPEDEFIQLFNCCYTDGTTQMLTVGGLLDTADARQKLVEAGIFDHPFIITGNEPVEISVPNLTIREKQWLDTNIVGKDPRPQLAFELKSKYLKNYLQWYRYYPAFYEAQI